jgi:hypothetical protein
MMVMEVDVEEAAWSECRDVKYTRKYVASSYT